MEVLFLLIGISLLVAFLFLYLFLKSVQAEQYDDMVTPGMRILLEDSSFTNKSNKDGKQKRHNGTV